VPTFHVARFRATLPLERVMFMDCAQRGEQASPSTQTPGLGVNESHRIFHQ
jgi:hypothetical protein